MPNGVRMYELACVVVKNGFAVSNILCVVFVVATCPIRFVHESVMLYVGVTVYVQILHVHESSTDTLALAYICNVTRSEHVGNFT